MTSIKDRLAAAKLPERSLQVCLRGDLQAEFDDLERALQNARQSEGARRLNNSGEAKEIALKMAELQDQMREEMVTLRIRALPRSEWQALVRKYPPKKDSEGDAATGADIAGLMDEAIPRCIADPELDAEDWQKLNEHLSSGDFDRLLNVVWDVNRSGVDVPKSRLASLVMTEAGADSK